MVRRRAANVSGDVTAAKIGSSLYSRIGTIHMSTPCLRISAGRNVSSRFFSHACCCSACSCSVPNGRSDDGCPPSSACEDARAPPPSSASTTRTPLSAFLRTNRHLVSVLGVEIDQRDERAAVAVRADRARLRRGRHLPAFRQQHGVAQPLERALEYQLVAHEGVARRF